MSDHKIPFFIGLIFSCNLFSQTTGNRTVGITLPVITLMDIEPPGAITMNFTAPIEAGRPVVAPNSNTTKWINYTSAITQGGLTRRITASINQILPGVDIKIQTASASGIGGGTLGTPSSQITLNTTAQTLISGIGGAFTGNGANNGHRLTISMSANTYGNLSARTNTPVVITYTIIE
ncbi:hypothetical protein [Chryseobacterium luquanense]|uniref:DUF4402 domain-containing protein n=1 Tax=Chryseobacterium luquanense TaxID=2983766 RepID=A0ABT3Y667_9FLAO|nr:hypothetical protein [Chryseobacterium luquanense]MCX8533653.1 hypothetical protein [Chryseobacterium luquanense]